MWIDSTSKGYEIGFRINQSVKKSNGCELWGCGNRGDHHYGDHHLEPLAWPSDVTGVLGRWTWVVTWLDYRTWFTVSNSIAVPWRGFRFNVCVLVCFAVCVAGCRTWKKEITTLTEDFLISCFQSVSQFLSMMCRCFALSLFIHHTGTQSRHDAHYNIMHNHGYTVDAWMETAKNTVIIWMQILSVEKWNFRQH